MKKGHSSEALTTWRERKKKNQFCLLQIAIRNWGERDSRGKGVAKPSIEFQRRIRQCENTHKHWNSQFLRLEWQQLWINTWIGCYKSVSHLKMGEEQFELLWIMPTQIAYFEDENSFVFQNIHEYMFSIKQINI